MGKYNCFLPSFLSTNTVVPNGINYGISGVSFKILTSVPTLSHNNTKYYDLPIYTAIVFNHNTDHETD